MTQSITLCITSYNRFELLKQTIDSFIALNKTVLDKILIIEDSTNIDMKNKILKEYGNAVELIFNTERIGQVKSIDKAYQTITTKYIFHSEDDYLYIGNSDFVQNSIDILEERSDIHQVWIRHLNDFDHSHGAGMIENHVLEKDILQTGTNVRYRMIKSPHCGNWCGFSWNPGLRRTQDYKTIFPNGFASLITNEASSLAEAICSEQALKNNYRAAFLINGACKNLGFYKSTFIANSGLGS